MSKRTPMQSKLLKLLYPAETPFVSDKDCAEYEKYYKHSIEPTSEVLNLDFVYPTSLGIEVEIETVSPIKTVLPPYWKAVEDGSLRNHGLELVSIPLKPNQVNRALMLLDRFYTDQKKAEFSHRCSIHVHLGVGELTMEQIEALITLYLTIEEALFVTLFPERRGNTFCFPLKDTDLRANFLHKGSNLIEEICKYSALNLYHLRDYNTLEFRHHGGTKNIKELQYWLRILCELYNSALKYSKEDILTELNLLSTTSAYVNYMNKMVPSFHPEVNRRVMYNAVLAAKHFLAGEDDSLSTDPF